jgi:hypothetical protein
MNWLKKGLIFCPDNNYEWMVTHAQVPIVDTIDEETLRIYFGTRDVENRTVTTFITVSSDSPENVLYVHDKPVLGLGKLGCFDDSGAMPTWIVNYKNRKYLYYIGWNVGKTVPYRNAIGIAISDDGGRSFNRMFEGPIIERTHLEPHFPGTACVLIEGDLWRMWYLSTQRWEVFNGRPEPFYNIKYAESMDGINWNRKGIVCIDFKSANEGGISQASVIKDSGLYRMWYSYRGANNYREDKKYSYRIGYAESTNGKNWTRKDTEVGIERSRTGWDSEMICYPHIVKVNDKYLMFYNGNGFGKSGFGYAELEL